MSGLNPKLTKELLKELGLIMGDLIQAVEDYSEKVEDQSEKAHLDGLVNRARDLNDTIGDAILAIVKGPPPQ